jgi:hypothetical protein
MNVRDRWLRNVAKYFEALHEEEIADLKLSTSSKNDGPLDYDQVLAEVLEIQRAEKESDNKEIEDYPEDGEVDHADAPIEEDDPIEDVYDDRLLLFPRSYRFFYRTLLRKRKCDSGSDLPTTTVPAVPSTS